MRFAVADDVLLARKAVEKLILEWDRDSTVCCSCDNGDEVLKVLEDQKVDVLVTDIRMPGLNGIALSEVVRQRFPSVDVVLVSGYATFDYARAALHNGVRDYLLKPLKREDLFHTLDAIKKARKTCSVRYKNVPEAFCCSGIYPGKSALRMCCPGR